LGEGKLFYFLKSHIEFIAQQGTDREHKGKSRI